MKTRFLPFVFFLPLLLFLACTKTNQTPTPSTDKNFVAFTFKAALNPALPQDIVCEIQGDTIHAVTFSGVDITALKGSFTTTGTNVTIGNEKQVSEQTTHNFSSPTTYTLTAEDGSTKNYVLVFSDTQLPTVYISTNGVPIDSKENYVQGYLRIKNGLSSDSLFGGDLEIRGRGNSTWNMPKKPYKIKLAKKAGLLGLHKSKQWVLLANYADKSLVRNEVGFELSRRIGLAYTPSARFVDLILNGVYVGNYQLTDQIDVDENKVNIKEQPKGAATLPDISGGYLTEVDGFAYTEAVHFTTSRNMAVSVHYPDDDEINSAQIDYITQHFGRFEDSLFSPNFADPVNGYQKYFDLDSYVNWYLVNEIIGNPDIFWSTYLYKNFNNDKLFTGPVWDLDIAANNDERIGDAVNKLMIDVAHEPKTWIHRLMEDKTFRTAVRARWNIIKPQVSSISSFVEGLAAQLSESQKKNFQRWDILQQKVYLNLQVAGSYGGEVNYLKAYLTNRIAWLDITFNGPRFD